MMRSAIAVAVIAVFGVWNTEARQLGQITKGVSIAKKANDVRELSYTEAEEQELGKQSAHGSARATVWCRTGPRTFTSASSAPRWRRAARGRTCRGRSSSSTPTASTRLRHPGLRAHHARALALIRTNPSWLACSATGSSTSPRSTPSARSRKTRRWRWARLRHRGLMQLAVNATYDNIVERGFGRAEENSRTNWARPWRTRPATRRTAWSAS